MDVTPPLDLTPRTTPPEAGSDPAAAGAGPARSKPPRSRGQGVLAAIVLVVVLGGVGFLLIKQVGSASLYYYNADQAVAKKAELGTRHFRIQGTFTGTKTEDPGGDIRFTIAFNGAKVRVDHSGSQPALFRPGIGVVLEGRWSPDGREFLSDRIEVKHSEVYTAKHPDRVAPDAP